jgi:hypothetical protein
MPMQGVLNMGVSAKSGYVEPLMTSEILTSSELVGNPELGGTIPGAAKATLYFI